MDIGDYDSYMKDIANDLDRVSREQRTVQEYQSGNYSPFKAGDKNVKNKFIRQILKEIDNYRESSKKLKERLRHFESISSPMKESISP